MARPSKRTFPPSFWVASGITLCERTAFYAVASFSVVYLHENLGMGPALATLLNGALLWGLALLLPLFRPAEFHPWHLRRFLGLALAATTAGYLILGYVRQIWNGLFGLERGIEMEYTLPVVLGILLIALGRSFVQPTVAATMTRMVPDRPAGAMGILFLVTILASLAGRVVSLAVRTGGLSLFRGSDGSPAVTIAPGIPALFSPVAAIFSLLALVLVLLFLRIPRRIPGTGTPPTRSSRFLPLEKARELASVFGHPGFLLFVMTTSLFWFLHCQIFNLVPLYLRFFHPRAPVELYTLLNPLFIMTFQIAVSKSVKRHGGLQAMSRALMLTALGIGLNLLLLAFHADLFARPSFWGIGIPVAGLGILGFLAALAIGEMMMSGSMGDTLSRFAPRGREALFSRYANLPVALGTILGAPLGGALFYRFMWLPRQKGDAPRILFVWLAFLLLAMVTLIGLHFLSRFQKRAPRYPAGPGTPIDWMKESSSHETVNPSETHDRQSIRR